MNSARTMPTNESDSVQSTIDIDLVIDAFEKDIARNGIQSVDVRAHCIAFLSDKNQELVKQTIVELLRVWMEHRWHKFLPTNVDQCKACFPEVEFSAEQLALLRFEEQRLRAQSLSQSGGNQGKHKPLERLPVPGQSWCDFELLELLGEGAFARVYLAKQKSMASRLVALKLTFRNTSESHWLAKLQHSAIVPIYSIHRSEDIYGICMPYLGNTTLADIFHDISRDPKKLIAKTSARHSHSGKSLLSTLAARNHRLTTVVSSRSTLDGMSNLTGTEALQKDANADSSADTPAAVFGKPLTNLSELNDASIANSPVAHLLAKYDYVQSILWIFAQLADALACAHREGILHSDIKPANILLAADGQPRLLDFNVALSASAESASQAAQQLGGTIAYMSPEHLQAIHDPSVSIDARSDIFSLGLVLFQMLTGKSPTADSQSNSKLSSNDAIAPIPSVRNINPNLSPALSAIVDRCLQLEPAGRYQNARDLYDDLMAQLEYKPLVHQPEPSSAERFGKWLRRHPRISSAGTIVGIAGLLLVASAVALIARDRQLMVADWQRRWMEIELLEPETISYLSASDVAPELRREATTKLHQLLNLLAPSNRPDEVDIAFLNSHGPQERQHLESRLGSLLSLYESVDNQAAAKPYELPLIASLSEQLQPLLASSSSKQPSAVAIANYLNGDFSAASAALQKQLRAAKQDYGSWLLLGNCYAGLQDHASAQQCYTACMALRPAIAVPQFFRGISRLQSGQFQAAIEDFDAVVTQHTSWTSAYFNRALAQQALGRFDEALVSLNLAIERGDRSVQAFSVRSQIHAAMGNQTEQQSDVDRALSAKPISEEDWVVHALLNLQAGNIDVAVKELGETLIRFPNSLDARQNLAHIYSDVANQPNLAMEQMDALIQADPGNPMRLAGRAVLLARQGQIERAVDDLRQAAAANPKLPILQYQIASCYSLIGEHQEQSGEKDSLNRADLDEIRRAAQAWFAKSILHEPELMAIIETDADFAWFRKQPEYSMIRNAIELLAKAEKQLPDLKVNLPD
jgi:eukaryotic-like serine/threonine-protein kinase